ncbi:HK97 family phage prohead protease [Agromyces sp. SYSU T00194]|uniref:HK97 family phage prohead protease n=1 Tax=Agromyces chitinivorans TaxID=3158560 RepID=UPI003391B2AA
MNTLVADLDGRRAACEADPSQAPFTEQRDHAFPAQLRASTVERDGKEFHRVEGVASVVDTWYEMYDFWGPFDERVASGAFDKTLAANPDVAFLLNHRGMTMARTRSGTLDLGLNEHGDLAPVAFLNPKRQDVRDLVTAIEDEDVDQMSFAFRIIGGEWSPDYSAYTITEVDLDRGDVSAVNFGANPYTSISARAKLQFLERALPGQSRRDALGEQPTARTGTSLTVAKLRHSLAE